jgi:hypothetical protein
MSTRSAVSAIAVIAAFGAASPLLAQQRAVVSGADLDAAVVTTSAAPEGDAVRQLLSTDHAQRVAGQLGISPAELSARVADIDDETLVRIAQQGGLDEQALAGGADTIVLSTTAVIIILLVLILVVS